MKIRGVLYVPYLFQSVPVYETFFLEILKKSREAYKLNDTCKLDRQGVSLCVEGLERGVPPTVTLKKIP